MSSRWYRHAVANTPARLSCDLQVSTDIIHFKSKKLNYYKGDYDTFMNVRAEQAKNQRRAYEASVAKKAHMQEFIDKFRYNAKRASLVQSRIKVWRRQDPRLMIPRSDSECPRLLGGCRHVRIRPVQQADVPVLGELAHEASLSLLCMMHSPGQRSLRTVYEFQSKSTFCGARQLYQAIHEDSETSADHRQRR